MPDYYFRAAIEVASHRFQPQASFGNARGRRDKHKIIFRGFHAKRHGELLFRHIGRTLRNKCASERRILNGKASQRVRHLVVVVGIDYNHLKIRIVLIHKHRNVSPQSLCISGVCANNYRQRRQRLRCAGHSIRAGCPPFFQHPHPPAIGNDKHNEKQQECTCSCRLQFVDIEWYRHLLNFITKITKFERKANKLA